MFKILIVDDDEVILENILATGHQTKGRSQ